MDEENKYVPKQIDVHNRKHTIPELLAILDKCLELYKESPLVSYHKLISQHCELQISSWTNYLNPSKKPNELIREKFKLFRDIQREKVIQGAMDGTFHPSFAAFFLKCSHGFIEESNTRKLALDTKRLDQQSQITDLVSDALNITFSVAPPRSEDDITNLLNNK